MMKRAASEAQERTGGTDRARGDGPRLVNRPVQHERKLEQFEAIMLPQMNAAYNLARWLSRSEADADDIVQEAYLRAFRFFDNYQGGDAKSWILTIVRNTCSTWRRQQGAAVVQFEEQAHTPPAAAPNVEQKLVNATRVNVLRGCIEALPPPYREVLVMRELEEMPYREIAEVAAIPAGTVMSRLSRARQRLEDCVNSKRGAGQ